LLIAKSKDVYVTLQRQFSTRAVKKRYVALLDGVLKDDSGVIALPLRLNPDDRPRQMVDFEHGKPAVTRYSVIGKNENRTLVNFFPETGRTHQLRVHAAHSQGLGCPIVGDNLYGTPDSRLYLHAAEIEFTHPVTGKKVRIVSEAEF
jgi:tRNA pseudouridine32 synthase/23S rRNA pseudouridine746 synthase